MDLISDAYINYKTKNCLVYWLYSIYLIQDSDKLALDLDEEKAKPLDSHGKFGQIQEFSFPKI